MALPGRHRQGQLSHTTAREAANLLSNGQRAVAEIDEAGAVPLAMRAGELSLHDTHLLHSSAPNRGRDRRIGVGIGYVPTHVRHVGARRLIASLVRGVDRYVPFDPESPPRGEIDERACAAHADACARVDFTTLLESARWTRARSSRALALTGRTIRSVR
jgi:hypothetical protein